MAPSEETQLSAIRPDPVVKEDVSTEEKFLENTDVRSQAELARLDRRVVLKLDLLVLPLVCTIYLLGYLDRANIGNARVVSVNHDNSLPESDRAINC